MKKIMFNDKYGLTQAVLDGRKTMTRRVVHFKEPIPKERFNTGYDTKTHQLLVCNGEFIAARSQYAVGEIVAISQSYRAISKSDELPVMLLGKMLDDKTAEVINSKSTAGWDNKMFVKAEHMPHHIQITNIRCEELQSIRSSDCLLEGIRYDSEGGRTVGWPFGVPFYYTFEGCVSNKTGKQLHYSTAIEAFSVLINIVSGWAVWESNPLVWVYEFKLID